MDTHEDDCPGFPIQGETFDSYPISYGYKCSVCGKDLPDPNQLTWPTWKA